MEGCDARERARVWNGNADEQRRAAAAATRRRRRQRQGDERMEGGDEGERARVSIGKALFKVDCGLISIKWKGFSAK